MKHALLLLAVACVCGGYSFAGGIPAGVPNMISYQGLLTTPAGAPVADGSYNLKFELFYIAGGGSAAWSETQSGITVQRGTFSVLLGSLVSLPAIFNAPLYLEVTAVAGPGIGAPVTFSPRTALASAAYSLGLKLPLAGYVDDPGAGLALWNYGTGFAVSGYHGSSAGTTAAISAQTNSTAGSARALEGIVVSTTPGGFSTAVRGQNNGTGGLGIGVWGSQNGSGWGVYGSTPSGFGVYGNSTSGYGVYGSSSTGIGVYANGTGYAVYSNGKLAVNAAPGDTSVQLPSNSISSAEILDEPGISSKDVSNYTSMSSAGIYTADSVDITAPADGYVEVTCGGFINIFHTGGGDTEVWLTSTAVRGSIDFGPGVQIARIPGVIASSTWQIPATSSEVYTVSQGAHRYYLTTNLYQASGTASLGSSFIRARYYPTLYGSVSIATPSSLVSNNSSESSRTDVAPADGTKNLQTITMEEHHARLEAKVAAVRAELEARIQKLEQLLAPNQQSPQKDQ